MNQMNRMKLRRMGIDTYQEPVIYMHRDCPVCQSEGFEAQSRILIALNGKTIIATLNVVTGDLLNTHEAGLSESAWRLLAPMEGDEITVSPPEFLDSLSHVRAKIYGQRLDPPAMTSIIRDVAAGRYSDLYLSAFITACAGDHLDLAETIALTQSMIAVGERVSWPGARIMDKHCVGGLPGNRTTLLVVPIIAACGLTIPKTSSRAITSPAGTADTMETLAPVALDIAAMRRVVEREGGCIVWGGAVRLSPADDILIRVARPLDLDSVGQLVASVLSKKAAAGATDVIIDIPVGATAKVRTTDAAHALGACLTDVGAAIGLNVYPVVTDGSQPVGRGIGPALEARDALAVLRGDAAAPADLRERSVLLAGHILERAGKAVAGAGAAMARAVLADGSAWCKFQAICEAQGGMRVPPLSTHRYPVTADRAGRVAVIDNRRLARVAKLAGAPLAAAAGVELHTPLDSVAARGEPLFTVHAQTPGELAYALDYVKKSHKIIELSELS
jgi:thymidine phosphorylase